MSFRLSARSRTRMTGLHPDLVRVIEGAIAITPVDFTITEGLRKPARQAELVKAGASRTLNSRHLTGHAVDVAAWIGGTVRWDWPLYPRIAGLSSKRLLIWTCLWCGVATGHACATGRISNYAGGHIHDGPSSSVVAAAYAFGLGGGVRGGDFGHSGHPCRSI